MKRAKNRLQSLAVICIVLQPKCTGFNIGEVPRDSTELLQYLRVISQLFRRLFLLQMRIQRYPQRFQGS